MARVTVERSLEKIKNRFDLVIMATERAYSLLCGAKPLVDRDNRPDIIAIREIEEGKIDPEQLREEIQLKYSQKATQERLSFEEQAKKLQSSATIDDDIFASLNLDVED